MTFPLLGLFYEIDIILIIVLLIGALIGMVRGAMPQLIAAVSIWFAMVIALWLYAPLSRQIIGGVFQTWSPQTTDTISFFVLFLIFAFFIRIGVTYVIFPPEDEERRRKEEAKRRKKREREGLDEPALQRFVLGPLNILGGLILGVVLTIFWWSISLGLLQFILQPELLQGVSGFLVNVSIQLRVSLLVDTIFNEALYWLFNSITLFSPPQGTVFATPESATEGNIVQQILRIILFARG